MTKLSDYVFDFVAKQGVKDVFLLSGGGCMHLVDSLGSNKDLNYVCCLHEQAVAIAASAYSLYKNDLAVALITTGPGGTNAITGAAGAWLESIPTLFISGQVKRADIAAGTGLRMLGFQELDIISMVKPITKYAVTILDPREIRCHLEKAVYLAKTGRPGPVWIDIPLDVQASDIVISELKGFEPDLGACLPDYKSLSEKVIALVDMIKSSSRPVIIAGYGIKVSMAEKAFLTLISKLDIPVLTTWKGCDILPDTHPLYFGRPGTVAQRSANFIMQNSDLVISVGARLDFGQIGYSHESFAREAKKAIVDIDENEIKKFKFKVDLSICTNAALFIDELDKHAGNLKLCNSRWLDYCRHMHEMYPVVTKAHWEQKDYVSSYALVDALSQKLSEGDLIVPGSSGACSDITYQAFKNKKGQRILNMPGLGAMGFGIPSAIGCCLASGKATTICVNGDGGFQLNIQEMETIKRLGLPIKFFVLNNDGYGSIKTTQRNYFKGRYVASDPSSGVTLPSLEKIAYAHDTHYVKMRNNTEIFEKIDEILAVNGPVLCEVMVDPLEQTMPKLTSYVKTDGSMGSKPLEDLWPFLDREEFAANMLIKPSTAK